MCVAALECCSGEPLPAKFWKPLLAVALVSN